MTAIEFLDSSELKLPKCWNNFGGSFDEYVNKILDEYLDKIKQTNSNDPVIKSLQGNYLTISSLCENVKKIIQIYFKGYPVEAFQILRDTIKNIEPYFNVFLSSQDITKNIFKNIYQLYRIRTSYVRKLSHKDIFHIPFEFRYLVSGQRYSIPGLPCLYLGGSSYVCWKELGEPPTNTIHISQFELAENATIKILDLGYKPADIIYDLKNEKKLGDDFYLAYCIMWPLIAVSSIEAKYKNANFFPEYIFPQLITQWITFSENKCDGVRYFSTNVFEADYKGSPQPICNFAFPVQSLESNGYCKTLASKFKFSEPLLWDDAANSSKQEHPRNDTNYLIKSDDGTLQFSIFVRDFIPVEWGLKTQKTMLLNSKS